MPGLPGDRGRQLRRHAWQRLPQRLQEVAPEGARGVVEVIKG
jgi:hypothetical protein